MALPKLLRAPDAPADAPTPARGVLPWTLVGIAIVVGILLYFRYERSLTPLVG